MNKEESLQLLYNTLKPIQKTILDEFLNNSNRTTVFHCSRRIGKTYLLCFLSILFCLKKCNAQVRYASVTQKAARKMVHPIFKEMFLKIPKKYRGSWNSQEGAYIFGNGSYCHVIGVNNGSADDARGTSTDLAIVDEASFVDDLSYLIDSVLMPQLLTVPESRLIMASSSPISPAHDFVDYIHKSKLQNTYYSYNIHEGGYSKELIEEFCVETGGITSTAWRREYLNQIIVDSDYSIIPEADEHLIIGISKDNEESSKYYHKYVSMDIGTRDLTVVIFGYYDFIRAKLCIQREFIINGPLMTTPKIAAGVKAQEQELWGADTPLKRVSDNNNLLLLQDLGYLHDCHFIPTGKDSLEAMVNELRIWVKDGRVEIDPLCTVLIESLKYGFWNEQRNGWGRSKTLGHFDAIAAIMYLVRNIDTRTNPIPAKIAFDQVLFDDENTNNKALSELSGLI